MQSRFESGTNARSLFSLILQSHHLILGFREPNQNITQARWDGLRSIDHIESPSKKRNEEFFLFRGVLFPIDNFHRTLHLELTREVQQSLVEWRLG